MGSRVMLLIFQMCFVRMAVSGIYVIALLSAVIPANSCLEF